MKIFAISDLHLSNGSKPMDIFGSAWDNYLEVIRDDWNKRVSNEDVVLLCGDFSWAMKIDEINESFSQVDGLKGKKIIIRGNHDYWWKSISNVRNAMPIGWYAIQNDAMAINGVIFAGSRGWTIPERGQSQEDEKILAREAIRVELSLQDAVRIRKNDEPIVMMIHFPPFNSSHEESIMTKLFEKYGVKAVVYGHLHGTSSRIDEKININDIDYYLTSCDLVKNKLVEIKI